MKIKYYKFIFIILAIILFFSTARAENPPYLVLTGPDVVQVGQIVTYTVSTRAGTDSSYTWWMGYTSNNAATIENGVLKAINPGLAGIRVVGNDTGAMAEMHVQVLPNALGGVSITGPDKVAIGEKEVFSATTGGVAGGYYNWMITLPYPYWQIATINADTGELVGVGVGSVTLSAVDMSTGLTGKKTVLIVSSEKKPAKVNISAGLGEGMTLAVLLSIQGAVPAGSSLYVAVMANNVIYYLPSFTTTLTPFRTNPTETYLEKILSVPIADIPYNTYTFYAVLLDSSLKLASNLDVAVVTAGKK
jgi:hypothetical protein